eukprot:7043150-Heterocapsa_arctica.AAC.1
MAGLLKYHWSETFSRKEVDFKDLDAWWKDDGYTFNPDHTPTPPHGPPPAVTPDPIWALTVEHVEQAILFSNDSSPGPDGIPYKAWR